MIMKLQLCLFAFKTIQDAKKYSAYNRSSIMLNQKAIAYNSDIIGKAQLSIELLYEYLGWNNKLQYFPIILLEAIKAGFKFKELISFNRIGYRFYIDKSVFYDKILEVSEKDHISKFTLDKRYINSLFY